MRRQMLSIWEDPGHWTALSRVFRPVQEVRHLLAACEPTLSFISDFSCASPTGFDL
jgi:hypothetical protein